MKRIAIHSAPRSGSSWLGNLFDAHPEVLYKFQPLFSYELKGMLHESSNEDSINTFFHKLENTSSVFLDQVEEKEKKIVPCFDKIDPKAIAYKEVRYHHVIRNLITKDKSIKLIALVRDPRSVLYSWKSTPREFDKGEGWDFEEEWRFANKKNLGRKEEFYGYEKWKELAILFNELERTFPNQVKIIRYTELLEDTLGVMKDLMKFCDLNLAKQQVKFIKLSQEKHNQDPYAVYKKRSNDDAWKTNLSSKISSQIEDELKHTELEKYLDEF
tara:strand:+ start:168 stop:980 length:813 start_codon:yes stop_codon:yes gene_type:complete